MWTFFISSLTCSFSFFWISVLCLTNENPLIKWCEKFQITGFSNWLLRFLETPLDWLSYIHLTLLWIQSQVEFYTLNTFVDTISS